MAVTPPDSDSRGKGLGENRERGLMKEWRFNPESHLTKPLTSIRHEMFEMINTSRIEAFFESESSIDPALRALAW